MKKRLGACYGGGFGICLPPLLYFVRIFFNTVIITGDDEDDTTDFLIFNLFAIGILLVCKACTKAPPI